MFTVFITCEVASEIFMDNCFDNRQICHDETDLNSLRDRFTTSLAITCIEKKKECIKSFIRTARSLVLECGILR